MKRVIIVLSIVVSLGFGIAISYGLASQNTGEFSLTKKHLDNLNLLVNLSRAGISTLKAATVDPKDYQEVVMTGKITATVETRHAIIYAYNGAEIPDFLINNFDRIFRMIVNFLNLRDRNGKIVVWVMNFETLQQIPSGPQSCFGACPTTLGALYAPIFNYLFFSPQHINDYYVTHELLHHFIDEYEKQVAVGLPQTIRQKYMTDVVLQNFLKLKEEEIVIDLSKIIVRKSLTSSLSQSN